MIKLKANIQKVENGFLVQIYGTKMSEEKTFIAKDYEAVKKVLEKEIT